jgi:glycolate oxidase iron-sulfur subunit
MDDLRHLVEGLQELDAGIAKCMRCGFCQNSCPMYGETHREFDVSRGKIALLANMADKLLTDAPGLADRLDRCLLCGSCRIICPSDTPTVGIFLKARALVAEYLGLSWVKKFIFRIVLPHPKVFDLAMQAASACQGLVFRKVNSAQPAVEAPLLSAFLGDRRLPPLPDRSLHETYPDLDTAPGASGLTVVLFPGCAVDRLYPQVGEACVKALKHHGVGVIMPASFTCCGLPALASGDVTGCERQVRHTLELVADRTYDRLITPCGSCTAAIKERWPETGVFTPAEREHIQAVADKAIDINAFLVDVLKVRPATPPKSAAAVAVTYHDPCHLKKALHVSRQPRDVILANPGYTLAEMSESDRCCGCGGSFTLSHYDYSKRIGQKKRDMIVATGAPVVATACPACMMQLTDMLSREGDSVRVRHSIELYAESLP